MSPSFVTQLYYILREERVYSVVILSNYVTKHNACYTTDLIIHAISTLFIINEYIFLPKKANAGIYSCYYLVK